MSRLHVEAPPPIIAAMVEGEERLREALRAIQEERATDDPLNGLVLMEGLDLARRWKCCARCAITCCRSARCYNAETVNGVMLRNSKAAAALYRQFAARFDPVLPGHSAKRRWPTASDEVRNALQSRRQPVRRRDPARASRTWCRRRSAPTPISGPSGPCSRSRSRARKVDGMVSPRPLFEIYVHSRKLEGIHLRGGKVARGGLRWSDRHDDFRTEILGLMKTQMVKNAIIVPVGAKGRLRAEGRAAAAAGARRVSDRSLPRVRLGPARRHRQHRQRRSRASAGSGAPR